MVNNLVFGYVYNKLDNINTPQFNRDICINKSQRKFTCDNCVSVCHSDALTFKEDDRVPVYNKDLCKGCKVCTKVCINSALTTNDSYEKILDKGDKEAVLFGCSSSEIQGCHQLHCIAELPPIVYMYLSIKTHLMLDLTPCKDCPQKKSQLVESLAQKISLFTGRDITVVDKDLLMDTSEELLSRRAFFTQIKKEALNSASYILPKEGNQLTAIKELLSREISQWDKSYKIQSLAVTEDCNGCKHCQLLCPVKAISIDYNSDTSGVLYHNSLDCIHCDVCKKVCNNNAITKPIIDLDKTTLQTSHSIKLKLCPDCKKPLPFSHKGELCIYCSRKPKKTNYNVDYKSKTKPII